jgi:hypothetical protein
MTPTPKLRFVEREVRIYICEGIARCEQHKFLQQWWEGEKWNEEFTQIFPGEWRDVPVEKEA